MGYEKSIEAMKIENLMPGGVNSPVRAFKSVDTPILWIMQKDQEFMISMVTSILTMY